MKTLFTIAAAGFICVSSFLPLSMAGDNPMLDFYNELAQIIENNTDNPDACVAQAKAHISSNIGPLQAAAQRGRQMAQRDEQKYEDMDQQDIEAAMQEAEKTMSDPMVARTMNESMAALDRFAVAFEQFASKYPDAADKITNTMHEYAPQEDI
ncbi:MAG: hypothetical protein V2A72_08225 [Candidatus Omnitrophota bacterium]